MSLIIQAQDSEERERWIRALEDTVVRHNSVRSAGAAAGSAQRRNVSIEDFDKKLGETDTYLEMLLEQVGQVKKKVEGAEEGAKREK